MYALILATSEGPNNPILPVTNEIIWGTISFFLLLVVMAKVAYPAMRKAMDDRTARIQGDLDAAEQAKDEAVQLKVEYEAGIKGAKAEAASIIDAAREEAEAVRAERIGAIDGEIAELRAQADADIDAAKERAMADIRSQVTALAVGAAERIVEQSLDANTQTQLVNNFIDRVGSES